MDSVIGFLFGSEAIITLGFIGYRRSLNRERNGHRPSPPTS